MTIITLSLIPSRFREASDVLNSLLAQDLPNTKVEVYIPKRYRRFPDYDGELPDLPKGVELYVVDEDLGPATKVLYAAEKYKNEAVDIIFCDDDHVYLPNWARGFSDTRAERPNDAIVATGFELEPLNLPKYAGMLQPRAKKSIRMLDWQRHLNQLTMAIRFGGKKNIPWQNKIKFQAYRRQGYVAIGEGCGGFMVKPQFFDTSMWNIPPIMWAVDDVWLSGHLDSRGIGIWAMSKNLRSLTSDLAQVDALYKSTIDGAGRDEANIFCLKYMQKTFGAWGGFPPEVAQPK